ncbi:MULTISPECIES: MalM family protein [unclassified Agarivorans]|uniref:MalM family protein n=1 Tax=unclassified Agarivorans TaxID=2636026 RepID=UPI003D7D52B4
MRHNWFWIVVAALVLSACSSNNGLKGLNVSGGSGDYYYSPQVSNQLLDSAALCCNSLADIDYKTVDFNYLADEVLGKGSPAFNFDSGKSFFLAYKIPNSSTDFPITVSSYIRESLFAPKVVLLNSNFEVTRVVPGKNFIYKPARGFSRDRLTSSFSIRRAALPQEKEEYLLIYTTDALKTGKTQITHPAKVEAEARGNDIPQIPDPMLPNVATGVVEVQFNVAENSLNWLSGPLFSSSSSNATPAVAVQANQEAVVSQSAVGEPVIRDHRSKRHSGMLAETELFYNQLIQKMVTDGHIEKALQLVEEAEYAGSQTARDTFIKAVKN